MERRNFLKAAAGLLIAAPAVIRVAQLMPIKAEIIRPPALSSMLMEDGLTKFTTDESGGTLYMYVMHSDGTIHSEVERSVLKWAGAATFEIGGLERNKTYDIKVRLLNGTA